EKASLLKTCHESYTLMLGATSMSERSEGSLFLKIGTGIRYKEVIVEKIQPPFLMPIYSRLNISFTHGDGAYLFASDGRRYLDFMTGIAVNALGHAHPHLTGQLHAQVAKVLHLSNFARIPEQERLAQRLCEN